LTHDLAKCYVGEDKIMQCLDRQKVFFEEGGFWVYSQEGTEVFVQQTKLIL